jgi:hypothetical protein
MKNFIFSLVMFVIQVAPHPGPDKVRAIGAFPTSRDGMAYIDVKINRSGNTLYLTDSFKLNSHSVSLPKSAISSIDVITGETFNYGNSSDCIVSREDSSLLFSDLPLHDIKSCPQSCVSISVSEYRADTLFEFKNKHIYICGMVDHSNEIVPVSTLMFNNPECNSYCHCRCGVVYIIEGTPIDRTCLQKQNEDRKKASDEEALFYPIPKNMSKSLLSCKSPLSTSEVITIGFPPEFSDSGEPQTTSRQKPNIYPNSGTHTEHVYSGY